MRGVLPVLLTTLCGSGCDCSGGLQLETDADDALPLDDAGPPDDASPADDSGLAPLCDDPPTSCLRAEAAATVEVNQMLVNSEGESVWLNYVLQGLSGPGTSGPVLLGIVPTPTAERGVLVDLPRAWSFDESGHVLDAPAAFGGLELTGPYGGADSRGDVVRLGDGSVLAVWRLPVVEYRDAGGFSLAGYRTAAYRVDGEETTLLGDFHQTGLSEADQVFPDATAVDSGGRAWVLSGGPEGVLLSPLDDPERVISVPSDPPPTQGLHAAALPDDRVVAAWSEWVPPAGTGFRAEAAIVGPEGILVGATEVFAPVPDTYGNVDLAVNGADIYVARYDRDRGSLRDSRIRIARLDDSLHRVEPDRWINGWGGVTPGGMALLAWQGGIWVVFQTLDARYGTNPVLFAQPLAVPACGYPVDVPAAVFPPHWAFLNTVLAAPGDDEIWTVVAYARDNATADLFRLVPCH